MSVTTDLVSALVDYDIEIEDIAADRLEAIRARFAELLRDPELINDELSIQFIEAEMELTDLPDEFWDTVADVFDIGFNGLHELPLMDRGEAWEMSRQIYVAVAQRQALLESGAISDAMAAAVPVGEMKRKLAGKVDLAELEQNKNFKSMMKARRNAIQGA